MGKALSRFIPKNPFTFIWWSLGASIAGSAFLNAVQSLLHYGFISGDLLIIGTIDAVIISVVVSYIVINLITTQQKAKEEELKALLITDELTQLHNRRGFFLLAEQLTKLADRMKKPLDIMYLDLDGLKWINDTYGHDEGDAALIAVAAILKRLFRRSDIIARMGGDEFVVMRVGTAEHGNGIIQERVTSALQKYNEVHDDDYPISVSMGFSRYDPASPASLDQLLKEADESMYRDKKDKYAVR
jgi:diguanylate cyclase (GGDEF)-like protein